MLRGGLDRRARRPRPGARRAPPTAPDSRRRGRSAARWRPEADRCRQPRRARRIGGEPAQDGGVQGADPQRGAQPGAEPVEIAVGRRKRRWRCRAAARRGSTAISGTIGLRSRPAVASAGRAPASAAGDHDDGRRLQPLDGVAGVGPVDVNHRKQFGFGQRRPGSAIGRRTETTMIGRLIRHVRDRYARWRSAADLVWRC